MEINLSEIMPEWTICDNADSVKELGVYSLYMFILNFPSLARNYLNSDKRLTGTVQELIKKVISPAVMENEIKKLEIAQAEMGSDSLSFTLYKSTKEIFANYTQGEIQVQIKLKIPFDYPLKSVEVDCTKQLKLPQAKLTRWILSIKKMISH
jgi:E3 ubiquitin-protein ligase listerin